MLRMGLFLAAVLVPAQLFFGHLVGDYVHDKQPAKFAAIEGRWHTEQPASEVLIALPDETAQTNRYAISVPILGSLIASMSFSSKEVGLADFPVQDRPPVAIPFFAFRIMVGCGFLMLFLAWYGSYLSVRERIARKALDAVGDLSRLSAAVDRDPQRLVHRRGRAATVDHLRCAADCRGGDAVTDGAPSDGLAPRRSAQSTAFIFAFGIHYIYRLLRTGPAGRLIEPPVGAVPNRPMSVVHHTRTSPRTNIPPTESMSM